MEAYLEPRERRTLVRSTICWLLFVGTTFALATMSRWYVGPYRDLHDTCEVMRTKANITLHHEPCNEPRVRAALEGYNMCSDAERRMRRGCTMESFYQLMEQLNVCRNGVCSVLGVNVTASLWTLWQVVALATALTWIAVTLGLVKNFYVDHRVHPYAMPQHMYYAPPPPPLLPSPDDDKKLR